MASVVVFDAHDNDHVPVGVLPDLKDQTPLLIQPHGPLVSSLALELLVVERLEGMEVALVLRGPDVLHPPAEGPYHDLAESRGETRVAFESLKLGVGISDFQGSPFH